MWSRRKDKKIKDTEEGEASPHDKGTNRGSEEPTRNMTHTNTTNNAMPSSISQHDYDRHRKHIVILGSGFAGIEVLKRLQKKFKNKEDVAITLVSRDNFALFTPMLPEVASGMIETRHIVTPVRSFCSKATFYQATVHSIDLKNKEIITRHPIGKLSEPSRWDQHALKYDHLVIAL